MSVDVITPGYVWTEIAEPRVLGGDFSAPNESAVDLQALYPINNEELLQQTWDDRIVLPIDTSNGVRVTTTTFNRNAENGAILWLPGWGVSNLRGGGARVATVLAALNPDKVVITGEELENVPDDQKRQAAAGDMQPYADNYMFALEGLSQRVDTLSGHSRGGVIQTHLASRSDLEGLDTINLMDMPRARSFLTAVGFGMRVGLLDNRVQGKYMHLSSTAEEGLLHKVIADGVENNGGQKEALLKAKEQWWLIQAMRHDGLGESLAKALNAQPQAEVFLWHGTKNIGTPVTSMRRVVSAARSHLTPDQSDKLHYFEAPTGHFSEGHTARYGRQTAFAVDQTSKKRTT